MAHLSPDTRQNFIEFVSDSIDDEIPNLLEVKKRGNILFLEKKRKEKEIERYSLQKILDNIVCYPNRNVF